MNNGFPGSFTPMGHNMALTCFPNVNGPQPVHCVLHRVDTRPVSHVHQQIVTVQNSRLAMRETHPQGKQAVDRLSSCQKPGSKEMTFRSSGPCTIVGDKIFRFSKEDVTNPARKITNDKEYEAALVQFKKNQASCGKIKEKIKLDLDRRMHIVEQNLACIKLQQQKIDAERKKREEQWKQQDLEHKKRFQEAMSLDKHPLNIESRLSQNLSLATPQQTKVAGQLLDIGIKASITGVTAITLKDAADRITADERDPITALSRAGSPTVTGDYLSSLQDKSAPVHTGNTQPADTTLRNTAGSQPSAPQVPRHTGNNQIPVPGATHTGNTAGVTDSGIKATITPIPDGPGRDDLAYLAGGYQPNKGAVGNMGEWTLCHASPQVRCIE